MPKPRATMVLPAGYAKIIAELPVSDGLTAQEIHGFRLNESNLLDSTFRLMPLIPDVWRGASQPAAFNSGVRGIGAMMAYGETPEILFLTGIGVYRYAPWTRASGGVNPGLEAQSVYPLDGSGYVLSPQTTPRFPAQTLTVNNRIYFTFGDGAIYTWDRFRLRAFGYAVRPASIVSEGPQRNANSNDGGFSVFGRIGNTEADWTDATNKTVGGIDNGAWRYGVAYENVDGSYSATSPLGGAASINLQLGDTVTGQPERLTRRFHLTGIGKGPAGTVARIILRTPNLVRLPEGDDGSMRFCFRISNNEAVEAYDDVPDGELGMVWEHRMVFPPTVYVMAEFSGSLWCGHQDGAPSRLIFSERGVPESFLEINYIDVGPSTGPITALQAHRSSGDEQRPILLVWKAGALHFLRGDYPFYYDGLVHARAGCAGPQLVQTAPNGDVLWYGAGTFWTLRQGAVLDIGTPIRKRLRRVNTLRAQYGVSWVDAQHGEVVFVLPMDDNASNTYQFIWDYANDGWRTRSDVAIRSAATVGGLIMISGSYGGTDTVWVYNRGYASETTPDSPLATYTTGWTALDMSRPTGHYNNIVLNLQERSSGELSVICYQDWALDEPIFSTAAYSVNPEVTTDPQYTAFEAAPTVATWGAATWGTSLYRSRRYFDQSVRIDVASAAVIAVTVSSTAPFAVASINVEAAVLAMSGKRSPNGGA